MKKSRTLFAMILVSSLYSHTLSAATSSLASFDLFTFPLAGLDQHLVQRAQTLGKALTPLFSKSFSENDFKENSTHGACFLQGADLFRLAWLDSETEGFRFSVEKLTGTKECENPSTPGVFFNNYPLDAKAFFPISRGHSSLRLGVSTPAEVRRELGAPDYADSGKIIYALKRDKLKEKNCQYSPKQGDFAAVEVEFDFSQGKLSAVRMNNTIAGEC